MTLISALSDFEKRIVKKTSSVDIQWFSDGVRQKTADTLFIVANEDLVTCDA